MQFENIHWLSLTTRERAIIRKMNDLVKTQCSLIDAALADAQKAEAEKNLMAETLRWHEKQKEQAKTEGGELIWALVT